MWRKLSTFHVVHLYIVPTMLTELLYPLQFGNTPLHFAAWEGHTTFVERLLSTPGIDVNIMDKVSTIIDKNSSGGWLCPGGPGGWLCPGGPGGWL